MIRAVRNLQMRQNVAIFEIRQGALVPAQLGGVADESAHRQALDLVREQVAQVLRRPLFTVAWKQLDAGHSLVAIDGSGQVVAVELLPKLDSTTVVAAMGRLNATSHLGWAEIASLYPAGPTAFQKDWAAFHETMPARINPGPRLSIVSPSISPDVLSSLSVLSDSGLEVFSLSVRALSSGRNFVEIDRIDSHHLPVTAKLLPAGDTMDEDIEVGKSEATAAASAPSAATSTSAAASAPSVATPAALCLLLAPRRLPLPPFSGPGRLCGRFSGRCCSPGSWLCCGPDDAVVAGFST